MAVTPSSRSAGRCSIARVEAALGRERADVELVEHGVPQGGRLEALVAPREGARVDQPRAPAQAVGLPAAGGIGELDAGDHVGVVVARLGLGGGLEDPVAGVGQLVVAVGDTQADAVRRTGPGTNSARPSAAGNAPSGRSKGYGAGTRRRLSVAPLARNHRCAQLDGVRACSIGSCASSSPSSSACCSHRPRRPRSSNRSRPPPPRARRAPWSRRTDGRGPQRLRDDVPLRIRHHHDLRPPDGREAGGNRRRQRGRRGGPREAHGRHDLPLPDRRHQRGGDHDGRGQDPAHPAHAAAPGVSRSGAIEIGRSRWSCAAPWTPTTPRPAIASSTAAPRGSVPARPSGACPRPTAGWRSGLGRLRPYRRYYFRLTATNSAGTTTTRTRTFTTARPTRSRSRSTVRARRGASRSRCSGA